MNINCDSYKQQDFFGVPAEICTVEKDPVTSGLEKMADRSFVKYCEKFAVLLDEVRKLGLPEPGQQFRIVTRRVFNAIQFLEHIINHEHIIDLRLAVYSINFNAAKILLRMINDGYIDSATILMSNLRNKGHREKETIIREMFKNHPRIGLFFCSSHAKIFSCVTDKNNYYTVEGSGNLSFNSRIEQYVIDNDKALYDFTVSWMDDIRIFLKGKKELEDLTGLQNEC